MCGGFFQGSSRIHSGFFQGSSKAFPSKVLPKALWCVSLCSFFFFLRRTCARKPPFKHTKLEFIFLHDDILLFLRNTQLGCVWGFFQGSSRIRSGFFQGSSKAFPSKVLPKALWCVSLCSIKKQRSTCARKAPFKHTKLEFIFLHDDILLFLRNTQLGYVCGGFFQGSTRIRSGFLQGSSKAFPSKVPFKKAICTRLKATFHGKVSFSNHLGTIKR